MPSTTTLQDAIRVLFILVRGSDPLTNHPNNYVGFFDGKAKLHALDFWVRYPDFLAYELLNRYDDSGDKKYYMTAKKIIDEKEPDLRSIPMIRYRFGAFEDLNDTLSLLISKGLVHQSGEKSQEKIKTYHYYLTPLAFSISSDIITEFPVLKWYDDRAKLVKELAGNLGGSALKEIQYKHLDYAQTKLGTLIPSIKTEVISKLNKISETI